MAEWSGVAVGTLEAAERHQAKLGWDQFTGYCCNLPASFTCFVIEVRRGPTGIRESSSLPSFPSDLSGREITSNPRKKNQTTT